MPLMSALLDELEKQSRLLTAQEKVMLARMLIEGLDPVRPALHKKSFGR
jgi:hypothetical protein